MKNILFIIISLFSFSCQIGSSRDKIAQQSEVYKLTLNPPTASTYYYDMVNETNVEVEVSGKDMNSYNKSTIGLFYTVTKDSTGNFTVQISYDKIQLTTKSGETELELDAANAAYSVNPVEKMLGILKSATLSATLTPKGEMKELKGYKELGDKLVAGFKEDDTYGKAMAKQQWEGMIGKQLVKNNMEQLFKTFPDSIVHVGDQWKITSTQEGEFRFNLLSTYTLKEIKDGTAIVEVTGTLINDKGATALDSYSTKADLTGKQEGEYKVNMKTGMPVSSTITSKIEGSIQLNGQRVPVDIRNKITMISRKAN